MLLRKREWCIHKLHSGWFTKKQQALSFLSFFLSLLFWNSLFFPCEEFLGFLSAFPFFSRDFRGLVGIKNPCFFVVFLAFFPKSKERKDRKGEFINRRLFKRFKVFFVEILQKV